MELLDDNPLPHERVDQVANVGRGGNEPRHAVAGALHCGTDAVAVISGEDPFDLEPGLDHEALLSEGVGQPSQELAAAVLVRQTVLPITVTRSPGPPRLRPERDNSLKIGQHAQVTDWCPAAGRGRHPVVEPEVVEAGRKAGAPGGQLRQPIERDRLDPGDASVVDERRCYRHHTLIGQRRSQAIGEAMPRLPLGDVHRQTPLCVAYAIDLTLAAAECLRHSSWYARRIARAGLQPASPTPP